MCWVKENRWGPGAASPLRMKVGLPVSTFLNLGIGRTSAEGREKVRKIVRARFISGNAHFSLECHSSGGSSRASFVQRSKVRDTAEKGLEERESGG